MTTTTATTTNNEAEAPVLIVALDAVRAELAGETYVSQSRCVDWLLDVYNLAERGSVRSMIEVALTDVTHRGLVTVAEVKAVLDTVELAWMVDSVFDHYEFPAIA